MGTGTSVLFAQQSWKNKEELFRETNTYFNIQDYSCCAILQCILKRDVVTIFVSVSRNSNEHRRHYIWTTINIVGE